MDLKRVQSIVANGSINGSGELFFQGGARGVLKGGERERGNGIGQKG
jgi:hypothetical protein